MIENESQIREIVSQYEELLKRAEHIVRLMENWQFMAQYFCDDTRNLSSRDNADKMISVYGYDDGDDEPCHYNIPLAWFFLDDKELEVAIAEKERKDEEEEKRREEEAKIRAAEESARQERLKEAEERATLLRLIEKYGVDGGTKDD